MAIVFTSDVVLPDMSGDRVASQFLASNPLGCVVFMTGYSDSAGLVEAARRGKVAILQKPFALVELAKRIRETLDRP